VLPEPLKTCLAFNDGVLAKTGRAVTHVCVCVCVCVQCKGGGRAVLFGVFDHAVMKITHSNALAWQCVYGQTGVHSIAVPLL